VVLGQPAMPLSRRLGQGDHVLGTTPAREEVARRAFVGVSLSRQIATVSAAPQPDSA